MMTHLRETNTSDVIDLPEWQVTSDSQPAHRRRSILWSDSASIRNLLSPDLEEEVSHSRAQTILPGEGLLLSTGRVQAGSRSHDTSSVYLQVAQDVTPDALASTLRRLWELPEIVRSSGIFEEEIDPRAVQHARRFLPRLFGVLRAAGESWYMPHLSSEGNGDVEFSWSYGHKSLSFSVTPSTVYYLKVWGANIDTEMEEGVVSTDADLIDLWRWMTR